MVFSSDGSPNAISFSRRAEHGKNPMVLRSFQTASWIFTEIRRRLILAGSNPRNRCAKRARRVSNCHGIVKYTDVEGPSGWSLRCIDWTNMRQVRTFWCTVTSYAATGRATGSTMPHLGHTMAFVSATNTSRLTSDCTMRLLMGSS